MKRVLVTGASGFVGRDLVHRLAALGYSVRAASRTAHPHAPCVEQVPMPDLRTTANWAPLLSHIDAIVHTAAVAHTTGVDDATYDAVNAAAVRGLACAAKGKVERLIFLSSVRAQTGLSAVAALTESAPPLPTDAYGRSKLAAEESLLAAGNAVVLRPVLVVGPGARGNLSTMLRIARLPIPLPFGCLAAERSIVARIDLCSAITHVLDGAEHLGQIYIVAHPKPITVAEMFVALRDGLGCPPRLLPLSARLIQRALLISRLTKVSEKLFGDLVASPEKLMRTGWDPKITPQAALAEMAVTWARDSLASKPRENGQIS